MALSLIAVDGRAVVNDQLLVTCSKKVRYQMIEGRHCQCFWLQLVMMLYRYALTLFFIFNFASNFNNCNSFQIRELFKNFKVTTGVKLSGHVIHGIQVSSSGQCAAACGKETSCISFNLIIHDNATMVCELNSNGLVDTFVTDVNSRYCG